MVRDTLRPGPIDARFGVQVICLRQRAAHPQVVATGRHVTCGGPDLSKVSWEGNTLAGVSELVAGDPYDLYVIEPAGSQVEEVYATGARVVSQRLEGVMRIIRLASTEGGEVRWEGAVPHPAVTRARWLGPDKCGSLATSPHPTPSGVPMTAATARLHAACLALLLLMPAGLSAQMRASERGSVSQTIDGTVITIDYSRPQVRGRDSLFGGVEHWGAVWTPGANWATTLEVNRPLTLDGHPLAPGKYSLWLVIQPEEWTMVIDPRHRMYHVPYPDSTADQIRYQVKPGTGPFNEMLTFTVRERARRRRHPLPPLGHHPGGIPAGGGAEAQADHRRRRRQAIPWHLRVPLDRGA